MSQTVSEDHEWHPARLIPSMGIKGTREQEQRTTSALLAVMRAVPEFGRALLADLGAPKGNIETFTEVSFDDGNGSTVRPDGVITVTRGKTRWVALVEVKTGTGELDRDQVIRYLDVAAREGLDGVLTVDNQILGGADDVPVEVPKKHLRRTMLWQLSWWRILTEATLQLEHRGVSDPDQAWILSELIAYLLSPSSGAGELDDMGPSWVKVRDGARHAALNKSKPEVADIARRWEQFIHYVALTFAQEIGRDVSPNRIRKPLSERLSATVEELASDGTLSMELPVPDAVGKLHLCADLRARMVTTSVEIKAPREGGPPRRVRWLLRQLKDAPDNLRIEVRFVRSSKTTTQLLGEVRDDASKLLLPDDPRREPRGFHLSLAKPMGIKRGSGPGSFVTDTRQQALDFYRELMQNLVAWRPKPPRMREKKPKVVPASTEPAPTQTAPVWESPPESAPRAAAQPSAADGGLHSGEPQASRDANASIDQAREGETR